MKHPLIRRLPVLFALASIAALPALCAARAETVEHKTVFNVRFGLLPVGKATFDIRYEDGRYVLDATGRTVGVAELVAPGNGKAESSGHVEQDRVVADRHEVVYVDKSKDRTSRLRMRFENGEVKDVTAEPDKRRKKNGKRWVQISEEQLRSVIDPASSVIIPVAADRAGDPEAVCNRLLNVYDGDTRYDIEMRYKTTRTVKTEGYSGDAYACSLRYIPVSGHRTKERNIEYMSANEDIEIWLAPVARTNLFTPIRIEVPTWVGRFTATPDYFGARQR